MSVILALFAGYSGTDIGVFDAHAGSGKPPDLTAIVRRRVIAGEDPFLAGESLAGRVPAVVVVPGGPNGAPWHPLSRLEDEARSYCGRRGVPAVVVHPMTPVVLQPEARLSGYKEYERKGMLYELPQRAAFSRAVETFGLERGRARIITVYLGDETSVAAHLGESVIDASDPVSCEGPFGFTSAGTLPATAFISFVSREGADRGPGEAALLRERLKSCSGALAYAGLSDIESFSEALTAGEEGAVTGASGIAYQVAKEIGRETAALKGRVDAVVLCGPGASLRELVSGVRDRVEKWTKVLAIEDDLTIPCLIAEGLSYLATGQGI